MDNNIVDSKIMFNFAKSKIWKICQRKRNLRLKVVVDQKPLTPKVSTTRNGKRRYEEGEFLFINYTNMCSVQFGVNASTTGISVHPDYEAEIRSDNVYQTKYKIN